jgi:hypothetical protein
MPIKKVLTPEEIEAIADKMEDDAYLLPHGGARLARLSMVYTLRGRANMAKWSGETDIMVEVRDRPP